MDLKDITNEYEKKEITKFLNNKPLVNVVKRVLLKDIYGSGILKAGEDPNPSYNFVFSLLYGEHNGEQMEYKLTNKELGEKVRACIEGIKMVQAGFANLERLKEVEKPEEKEDKNEAR